MLQHNTTILKTVQQFENFLHLMMDLQRLLQQLDLLLYPLDSDKLDFLEDKNS